jgi:hypothetical protein
MKKEVNMKIEKIKWGRKIKSKEEIVQQKWRTRKVKYARESKEQRNKQRTKKKEFLYIYLALFSKLAYSRKEIWILLSEYL